MDNFLRFGREDGGLEIGRELGLEEDFFDFIGGVLTIFFFEQAKERYPIKKSNTP